MGGLAGVHAFSRRHRGGGDRCTRWPSCCATVDPTSPQVWVGPDVGSGAHPARCLAAETAPAHALGRRPLGARARRRGPQPRGAARPPRLPVPHHRRHRGGAGRASPSKASASSSGCRASSPSPRTTCAPPPRTWCATAWASSRCTTATSPAGSPSPRRSRRCWRWARRPEVDHGAWTPTWRATRSRAPTPFRRGEEGPARAPHVDHVRWPHRGGPLLGRRRSATPTARGSDSDATEAVRDGVREAVRSRWSPMSPWGRASPAALDSSLVAAQAQQLRRRRAAPHLLGGLRRPTTSCPSGPAGSSTCSAPSTTRCSSPRATSRSLWAPPDVAPRRSHRRPERRRRLRACPGGS